MPLHMPHMRKNVSCKMTLLYLCLVFIAFIISAIYISLKRKGNYWKTRNVPFAKPVPILGNYGEYILLRKYSGHVSQEICKKFPNEPSIGTFYGTEPALLIQSPELIKHVTTKDFYYFSSREVSDYTHKEVFTQNLFFTYGDKWRVLRQNFSPMFSSAKMRKMFHLIEKCAHSFEVMLDDETKVSNTLEIKSQMARFTMDCIGSCVFGMETNVMGKCDEVNSFKRIGDMMFEQSKVRGMCLIARAIWPAIFYGVGLKTFPDDMSVFFKKLISEVFETRGHKPSGRNDIIDMIMSFQHKDYLTGDSISNMKTNSDAKINIKFEEDMLIAQCLGFFAAGFETTATSTSFTLYQIAMNDEVQRKVLQEVDAYLSKNKNKLDYDCMTELPYLKACFDEALRIYPVLGLVAREVVEDYTMPSGLQLNKGVRIHLPIYHMHHHPDYFPEPEKFRPERFLPEERHNIKPYTYMPFGEGPRICIGKLVIR